MPPGVAGGSAQGKSPTPNDVQLQADRSRVYDHRRCAAAAALLYPEDRERMQRCGDLRPVFPDWVQIMRLQACDYAAVVALVYRYAKRDHHQTDMFNTRHSATNSLMLWHVCGAPVDASPPMWPPDVAALHVEWLHGSKGTRRSIMCQPPSSLWRKGCMPKFPATVDQVATLMTWWESACVPPSVYELRPGN